MSDKGAGAAGGARTQLCSLHAARTSLEKFVNLFLYNGEDIDTSGRPLKDENVEKLNFIATNGPHPLVSMNLVDDMLTNYFGKDWHYIMTQSKWFVSKTVDHHFQCAKKLSKFITIKYCGHF